MVNLDMVEQLMKLMSIYVIEELEIDGIKLVKKRHIIEQKDQSTKEKDAMAILFQDKIPDWAKDTHIDELLKDPFNQRGNQ